jgi:hypothetical protein
MAHDDLHLALCVVKVLCLLVVAFALYAMAFGREGFEGVLAGKGRVSSSGAPEHNQVIERSLMSEPPVFWNAGNMEDINNELQAAAAMGQVHESFSTNRSAGGSRINEHSIAAAAAGL